MALSLCFGIALSCYNVRCYKHTDIAVITFIELIEFYKNEEKDL